ncbi:conserved hypothetical protein, partial [Streptomyces griseoflavus Tu4000]
MSHAVREDAGSVRDGAREGLTRGPRALLEEAWMSLVELIAQADERGLAVSGLACLDRCVPLLGDDEALRPLWASLAEDAAAGDWAERLEQTRGKLDAAETSGEDETVTLARRMLAAAPAERSAAALREWADGCSVAALR